ncbi:hypothetical protein HOL34_00965 [bacterium]|nr:hypothetical protein [bacterium]MBT3903816.1 hypothetical protein [bacterium]MBT5345485.1 hypothetical protein [bacterium]MBT6131179.1 hypothetical protein [bacterium]MBT6528662.1 hypothetical protein [bacterium]
MKIRNIITLMLSMFCVLNTPMDLSAGGGRKKHKKSTGKKCVKKRDSKQNIKIAKQKKVAAKVQAFEHDLKLVRKIIRLLELWQEKLILEGQLSRRKSDFYACGEKLGGITESGSKSGSTSEYTFNYEEDFDLKEAHSLICFFNRCANRQQQLLDNSALSSSIIKRFKPIAKQSILIIKKLSNGALNIPKNILDNELRPLSLEMLFEKNKDKPNFINDLLFKNYIIDLSASLSKLIVDTDELEETLKGFQPTIKQFLNKSDCKKEFRNMIVCLNDNNFLKNSEIKMFCSIFKAMNTLCGNKVNFHAKTHIKDDGIIYDLKQADRVIEFINTLFFPFWEKSSFRVFDAIISSLEDVFDKGKSDTVESLKRLEKFFVSELENLDGSKVTKSNKQVYKKSKKNKGKGKAAPRNIIANNDLYMDINSDDDFDIDNNDLIYKTNKTASCSFDNSLNNVQPQLENDYDGAWTTQHISKTAVCKNISQHVFDWQICPNAKFHSNFSYSDLDQFCEKRVKIAHAFSSKVLNFANTLGAKHYNKRTKCTEITIPAFFEYADGKSKNGVIELIVTNNKVLMHKFFNSGRAQNDLINQYANQGYYTININDSQQSSSDDLDNDVESDVSNELSNLSLESVRKKPTIKAFFETSNKDIVDESSPFHVKIYDKANNVTIYLSRLAAWNQAH